MNSAGGDEREREGCVCAGRYRVVGFVPTLVDGLNVRARHHCSAARSSVLP